MLKFKVRYTAYEGNSTRVLSEGIHELTCSTHRQAEDTVKSIYGGGGVNTVLIRSVQQESIR